jgi:hypothetical protein
VSETTVRRVHGNIAFAVGEAIDDSGAPLKAFVAIDRDTGAEYHFVLVLQDAKFVGEALCKPPAPGAGIAGLAVPAAAMGRLK